MSSNVRLFFKGADGLLSEVAPDEAEAARLGRRVSRVSLAIDVLLTPEEEAARDTEEAASAAERSQRAAAATEAQARRTAARAKLEAMGISADELRDALN